MSISISITNLLQHLLFVFLVVIAPIWDYSYTSRLKRNPSPAGKLRVYKTLCSWLWTSAVIAVLVVGWRPLFTINPAPAEIPWLQIAWVRSVIVALLVLFAAVLFLPFAIVAWKKLTHRPRKYGSAEALKSLSYFFPATWTERRWWAFLCLTAGICEEILFRGFLLHYLHVFPWGLNLTLALLVAAVIFGLNHLYGGVGGVIGSTVAGLLLGLLFLLTGSLLLPMILHAALDLRMLVILRPPDTAAAPA